MVCVKTIKVNSGWQGSGLWSQCYQHTVKLTVASSLTHCTAFSPDSCWWLKPAVCTLCWHYCPSLIKTVIFPWLSRFLHWKFIHFVRCLHWADKMSGKHSFSLSLSLFVCLFVCLFVVVFFFGGGVVKLACQRHSNRNAWRANKDWGQSVVSNTDSRDYGIQYLKFCCFFYC